MPAPRRTSASTTRLLLPMVGALAALLLAGCGGDSADPPATCAAPPVVTAGGAWQHFGPAEWDPACPTLTVRAPALAADERLAMVLINAGGPDNTTASIALDPAAFAASEAPPVAGLAAARLASPAEPGPGRSALQAGHALVVERRRGSMAALLAEGRGRAPASPLARVLATASCPAPPAVSSKRTFCVDKLTTEARQPEARPATLVHASADGHALYYVTDDVLAQVQALRTLRPDLWVDFEDYFEGWAVGARNTALPRKGILPALHASFGQETDYDGNCRQIFLFANLVKYAPAGADGVIVGFFDGNDLKPADPTCTGTGSNGADVLYLLDPATFVSKGWPLATVLDQQLPGTMAHELQHNVLANTRCLQPGGPLPSCGALDEPDGDLWLNEALSMSAEDFAGFGLHDASERDRVAQYLKIYQGYSLTTWPCTTCGDGDGDYGGGHAFLRWHLDQVADPSAFARGLVGAREPSRAAVATASGLTFEEGYARFATSALFSDQELMFSSYAGYPLTPAPDWNYAPVPAPWSPLHTRVGRPAFWSLPRPASPAAPFATTLRKDGWGSYVTRFGRGAEATLSITTGASVKPRVAVVRFKGTLLQP